MNVTVTVKVARKNDEVQTAPHIMKLRKFIFDYKYENWYLSTTVPAEMMEELPVSTQQ